VSDNENGEDGIEHDEDYRVNNLSEMENSFIENDEGNPVGKIAEKQSVGVFWVPN